MGILDRFRNTQPDREFEEYRALKENLSGLGLSMVDLQLGLADWQWIRLGTHGDMSSDYDAFEREDLIRRSRVYFDRDPMVHRSVRALTEYVFPDRWSITVKNAEKQKMLDLTTKSRRNRSLYSFAGQQKKSDQLLVDGELFFVFFVGPSTRPVQIRRIDPIEIPTLVTNPNDAEDVWGYERHRRKQDGGIQKLFYTDWDASDEGKAAMRRRGARSDAFVAHYPVNTVGLRGRPFVTAGLDWAQTNRRFMEDRATLTRALATFAFKGTAKGGGTNTIDRLKAKLASEGLSVDPTGGQAPTVGSTWLQTENLDLEQFSTNTGAGNANTDAYMFRLMVAAATGIPELFLSGSSADANLATASALIKPMENLMLSYQLSWMDIHRDIAEHVLEWQLAATDDMTDDTDIVVTAPPITTPELAKLADALSKLAKEVPSIMQPEVIQRVLEEMQVQNIPDVVKRIELAIAAAPDEEEEEETSASQNGQTAAEGVKV